MVNIYKPISIMCRNNLNIYLLNMIHWRNPPEQNPPNLPLMFNCSPRFSGLTDNQVRFVTQLTLLARLLLSAASLFARN